MNPDRARVRALIAGNQHLGPRRAYFTARELATVLAALRYWQREGQSGNSVDTEPEQDVATNGGTLEPLAEDEIDALCERLNRGE
jgi:hypothetical protein